MVQHMQLEDWLDDLCVRFIINLPQEDLSSVARICFQVEEAQWFYEDFIRPLDPTLPSMSLRTFCLRLFQHCPLLASFSVENHTKAFEEFLQYKTRVPVRGAILLNHAMDSVVLVKGWKKGANWSFPRGKINKDEDDLDCAVREVYEETGFDLAAAGLVPTDTKPKYIEIAMREQQLRLYVFRDVPMDTNFQPRTRKEISKIQWYKLSELPTFRKKNAQNNQNEPASQNNNKFYMVAPFLVPLKKWVISQKKLDDKRNASGHYGYLQAQMSGVDDTHTEDDTWAPAREGARSQVPALDTLDGATRELQRLLKMQPPTQGVQPPAPQAAQQDKGSALLSILQADSQKAEAAAGNEPHPVMEQMYTQGQFPPNAHFQGNQQPGNPNMYNQQGMPIIPGPQGQQPPMGYDQQNHQMHQRQYQLHQQLQQIQQQAQQLHQLQQQHRHQESNVPLAHPQPLAPQVQPGVFNVDSLSSTQQQSTTPAAQKQQPGLSGQSMALLNAFKRDTSHQPSVNHLQPPPPPQQAQQAQRVQQPQQAQQVQQPQQAQRVQQPQQAQQVQQPQQAQHHQQPQQYPPQHLQQQQQQQQQQQYPQHPQHAGGAPNVGGNVGGSAGRPAPDQHRTSLLDMFKKPNASPVPNAANPYPAQVPPQHQAPQPNPQDLPFHKLSVQQAQPPAQMQAPPQQYQQQQQHQQQQQQQKLMHILTHNQNLQAHLQQEQQQQQQQKPMQILSHGQNPQAFQGQQHHGAPQPAQNGQSGPPGNQKSQLLSLFGKQQQAPPAGPAIHEIAAGTPDNQNAKTRLGSLAEDASRRDSETPISPADETFLLGYLQSVTNNAQR